MPQLNDGRSRDGVAWDPTDLMPPVPRPAGLDSDSKAAQEAAPATAEPSTDLRGDSLTPRVARAPLSSSGATGYPTSPQPRTRTDATTTEAVVRALTTASLKLRRGLVAEARQEVDGLLALQPRSAAGFELRGDIEMAEGYVEAANTAYRIALEIEPGRPTAEIKLARGALRATEDLRRATLGVAYAGTDSESLTSGFAGEKARNPFISVVGSLILPGVGQILNGQYLKGGIMMAVCALAVLFLSVTLGQTVHGAVSSITQPQGATPAGPRLSGLFWFWIFLSTATWVYSAVDAYVATRRKRSNET